MFFSFSTVKLEVLMLPWQIKFPFCVKPLISAAPAAFCFVTEN
jgi:hypothetical protein